MHDTSHFARHGARFDPWPTRYDPAYRPNPTERYWFPELETADPRERDALILFKLKSVVAYAWERSSFYKKKWQEAGVHPSSLKELSDLAKFPVVVKADLRRAQTKAPPFGDYLCVEPVEVARVHGTSGTTGTPTLFGVDAEDWERIGNAHARIMWAAGIRPSDSIFIGSFFSLYLGSWGVLKGAERLGAQVLPFGAGVAGQTAVAVELMTRLRPTCFYGTPSYALRIAEVAREKGIDPKRDFNFRIMFFSGEPGASVPSTKKLIKDTFGASCIDMGSMAEMTPWMTDGECDEEQGMHLWQDIVYTEVCDPATFMPVPYGAEGTPVYTHLERTSQPMIRLVSGDLTQWTDEPCPCGRTYPRLPRGIYGRIDDVVIIRGHNVTPSVVEDVVRSTEGLAEEFKIVVTRTGALDEYTVHAEYTATCASEADIASLTQMLTERLTSTVGLRPKVELSPAGTLPRTEFKARRVTDERQSTTTPPKS